MAKNTKATTKATKGAKMGEATTKLSALALELNALVPSATTGERAQLVELAMDLFKLAEHYNPAPVEVGD